GNERKRRAVAAVAAAFGALRDDEIGARLLRDAHLLVALHLADQRRAGLFHRARMRTRIAERKHHRARPLRERQREDFRPHRPRDEADAPRTARRLLREPDLARDPLGVAVTAADESESA